MTEHPRPATDEQRRVWRILHEECGAREEIPDDFIYHWPCDEYRFQGALGFGGKVWQARGRYQPLRVTCYEENATPERKAAIERANARLAAGALQEDPDER